MKHWCDADFSVNWRADSAHINRTKAKSRTRLWIN